MNKQTVRAVLFHLVGWVLGLSFIVAFVLASKGYGDTFDLLLSKEFLVFSFIYLFIFYLNSKVLFPGLYVKKKYFLYFFIFLLLLVTVYLVRPFDLLTNSPSLKLSSIGNPDPGVPFGSPISTDSPGGPSINKKEEQEPPVDIIGIIVFLMIWSVSTVLRLIKQWQSEQEKAAILEAEKAHAELAFLKAQINPHFLFNTLNNIYSMAISNNEHTAPSIMKLSKIMRYVTDEVSNDSVALTDEVECISDYIELHKLKLNEKTTVVFKTDGQLEGRYITPLILIPFVETF
jgi:hypothetical protein